MHLIKAFKAFFSVLFAAGPPESKLPEAPEKPVEAQPEPTGNQFNNGAVYALTLLQREGRLIDFLQEDISGYDDAQIGAAVRQIHCNCRKVLDEHFKLAPVIDSTEGLPFAPPENFDPATIRLTGNVPESKPGSGTLQHRGWTATNVNLPSRGTTAPEVVYPAEVSY